MGYLRHFLAQSSRAVLYAFLIGGLAVPSGLWAQDGQNDHPKPQRDESIPAPGKLDAVKEAEQQRAYEGLLFQNSERYWSEAFRDTFKDPVTFWGVFVGTAAMSAPVYYGRYTKHRAALRKEAESVIRGIKGSPEMQNQLESLGRQSEAAHKELKALLLNAKRADFKQVMARLPPDAQKAVWAEMKQKGVKFEFQIRGGSATMEELTEKLEAAFQADKRHYEAVKGLAPRVEKAMNLKPGTLASKLRSPDEFMTEIGKITKKLPNPGAYAAEFTTYEKEMIRLAGLHGDDVIKSGEKIPLFRFGIPWISEARPSHFKNARTWLFKKTWPALLALGVTLTTAVFYQKYAAAKEKGQAAVSAADVAAFHTEEAIERGTAFGDAAYALMVVEQWNELNEYYGKKFDIPCPIDYTDHVEVVRLRDIMKLVLAGFAKENKNPYEGNVFTKEVYTNFYEAVLDSYSEEVPTLKNLPLVRDTDPEKAKKRVTRPELIDQLAVNAPVAFQNAAVNLDRYEEMKAALAKMDKKDQETFLKALDSASTKQILTAWLLRKAKEKEETEKEKDPDPEGVK